MTAAVTSHHNAAGLLRIYINDVLHLAFSTERMAGIQSWSRSHSRSPAVYAIEVTPSEGAATFAEYDDRDLWCDVLAEIDKAFGAAPEPPTAPSEGTREGIKNAPSSQQLRTDDGEQSPRPVATDQTAAANASGATPTSAAPAPGREDGESDAAFLSQQEARLLCSTLPNAEHTRRLIALARTQAQADGGVTEAALDAALDACPIASREQMRRALEAARTKSAPADGAGRGA